MEDTSAYEVRCPRCDVSFPIGTRRCFHCGGRTGPGRFVISEAPPELFESDEMRGEAAASISESRGEPLPIEAEEAKPPGGLRGRMNAGVSLVWIVLAVGFSIMRACGEG